jgi:hypothetical protein
MSRDLKSGFFFLGLSLLVIWESLRGELGSFMVPGSGFLTFGAGLAVCGLSLVLIGKGWKLRETQKPFPGRVFLVIVSLFIYSLVLNLIGFVLATFFLVGNLFYLGQPRQWWWVAGISAIVSALAYLIFGVFLHVYFPRGVLGI